MASTQFVPPSLPACSRYSPSDAAATAGASSYDPSSARYWASLASSRGLPGGIVGSVLLGGGIAAVCVAAAASAAAAARARRRRARLERRRRRSSSSAGGKEERGGSVSVSLRAFAATSPPPPTTTPPPPPTSTSPCSSLLSVLVLLLCASVAALSSWGIFSAASALKSQPRRSWRAASEAAEAARAALAPCDASVTLARQAQSGLLSLSESLPAIVSTAAGGGASSSSSTSSSAALLASLGVDVGGLQREATSAAAAAGEVADRGGDAASAVRSALEDGFERFKKDYEERTERASAAATAGFLALTLGSLVAASVFLAVASLSPLGIEIFCCRDGKARSPRSTRLLLAAAALSFLASSVAVAAGLAGGAVASEASRDACLFGETAAAREIVRKASSESKGSDGGLASKIALFYLDGGRGAGGSRNESGVFGLFGIAPELERLLLSPGDDKNATTLGGAALAFLQTDAGRNLVARAGLPARERRSILNLPETVSSLRTTAREFERAAAPSVVSRPSLLLLKELPCCSLPRASAPWAAASTAGGFVLAAAASLACFAAVAGAGRIDEEEKSLAPAVAVASPPPLAVLREEDEEGAEGGELEGRNRGCLPWWSRRRRDGFFGSRDAASGGSGREAGTGGEVEAFSPRPWPTL